MVNLVLIWFSNCINDLLVSLFEVWVIVIEVLVMVCL